MFRNISHRYMKRVLLTLLVLSLLPLYTIHGLEINQVGVYDFGVAYGVTFNIDTAFLSGNDGVDIFDITDKTNPVKHTRINCGSNGAKGLLVSDDILFIAAASTGLMIVDISDPSHPETLSTVTGIHGIDVDLSQGYAYVAGIDSFSVIDVSDPASPVRLATVMAGQSIYVVHVSEDTLYVGDTSQGLLVYDVTDPASPEYIRTVSNTGGIFDIDSHEDTLYLGCHGNGVKILDITDKQNPSLLTTYSNGGEAYGVASVYPLLLVADLQQGIEILDVSEPSSPTLEASWTTTHPHKIAGDAEFIYLADQDDGLEVFVYGDNVEPVEQVEETENRIPVYTVYIITELFLSLTLLRAGVSNKFSK